MVTNWLWASWLSLDFTALSQPIFYILLQMIPMGSIQDSIQMCHRKEGQAETPHCTLSQHVTSCTLLLRSFCCLLSAQLPETTRHTQLLLLLLSLCFVPPASSQPTIPK